VIHSVQLAPQIAPEETARPLEQLVETSSRRSKAGDALTDRPPRRGVGTLAASRDDLKNL